MRRKLMPLLLVAGLICWGIRGVVATSSAKIHAITRSHLSPNAAWRDRVSISRDLPDTPMPAVSPLSGSPHLIALTFDDGPDPTFTPQVLNILEQYGVNASFFCIGQQVQRYPYLVRRIYRDEDLIGNHSWSHPDLTKLRPDAIQEQLSSTSTAIQQVTGVLPALFRPPYGATNENVSSIASRLGLLQALWTIDTHDWQRPGVAAIVHTVLTGAGDRSIVLMHDGGGDRSQTVQALPQVIAGLEQRGFTFVTAQAIDEN